MTMRFSRGLALVLPLIALGIGAAQGQPTPQPAPPPRPQAAPEYRMVLEPRALELLKAASARLAAAKSLSFTATVGYEYPSRLGPPIVYTVRYDVAMQRPNKLKIISPGDGPATEFVYDGKEMAAFAPAEGLLAVADAPSTIDGALQAAFDLAAIHFPFTDLLADDPYAALTHQANLAFRIGTSTIVGGVPTEMLVVANNEVFMQVWIGAEDKLPRRVRAMYRADPRRLRHEMELSNWRLDGATPDIARSAAAGSARRIPFAHPARPVAAPAKP